MGAQAVLAQASPSALSKPRILQRPAAMNAKTAVTVFLGALFMTVTLQGCGCNEEEASSCMTSLSLSDLSSDGVCTYINDYVACYDDNGCCDEEGVSEAIKVIETTYESVLTDCDIVGC